MFHWRTPKKYIPTGVCLLLVLAHKAKAWCDMRSALLGSTATTNASWALSKGSPAIEYVRVADAKNPRIGVLVQLGGPTFSGYNNSSNSSADFFATALSVRLKGLNTIDGTTESFSNHLSVGQPDSVCQAGAYVGSVAITPQKTFDTVFGEYMQYLTSAGNALGYMGMSSSDGKKNAINAVLNENNKWRFTCTAHGYSSNDRIRITSANSTGFAGVHRILVIDANTLELQSNLSTGLTAFTSARCNRVQLASGVLVSDFYRFQVPYNGWSSPWGIKISKKNPSRPFSAVSFRRRTER